MNAIKRFLKWIMQWVVTGAVVLMVLFAVNAVSGGKGDSNSTKKSSETHLSKEDNLMEVRKEYWENGNLKLEVPYKKHYGLGWRKVKTTLTPHGIAKEYYENGVLKKEDPYVDGKREGILKLYDANGTLEAEAEFRNDKRDGKSTYYYSDGSIMEVEYYKEGNLTQMPHNLN